MKEKTKIWSLSLVFAVALSGFQGAVFYSSQNSQAFAIFNSGEIQKAAQRQIVLHSNVRQVSGGKFLVFESSCSNAAELSEQTYYVEDLQPSNTNLQGSSQDLAQPTLDLNPNLKSDCGSIAIGNIKTQSQLAVSAQQNYSILEKATAQVPLSIYGFLQGQREQTIDTAVYISSAPFENFSKRIPGKFFVVYNLISKVGYPLEISQSQLMVWNC